VRVDVAFWAAGFDELHEHTGKRSGRPEPRRRALAYLLRLLAGLELRTGGQRQAEPAAEDHAADLPPQGHPHLMRRSASVSIF
jgi:hypothetical protein